MGSRAIGVAVAAAALAAGYLAFWPLPVEPVAWRAPHAPAAEGPFAPNGRLRGVEPLGAGNAAGPEATAIDARGRVHTGTADGRILRLDPRTGAVEALAHTGGRPLGMAFDREGRLYVADATRGLLALSPSGELAAVASTVGGARLGVVDDVDVGPDGVVYFTEATNLPGLDAHRADILEHGGRGRLLAYHPDTGGVEVLLAGLQFANGVAVAGDGSFVAVSETGAYRVTRRWLRGPRRGTSEPLIENLPGLPDNVTWSGEREAFWIALFSPRVPVLDTLAGWPRLRAVVLRLPRFVQPEPAREARALAVDTGGRLLEYLDDASPSSYAPLTSVRERDGVLWLGSLERDGLGRLAAPPLLRARAP